MSQAFQALRIPLPVMRGTHLGYVPSQRASVTTVALGSGGAMLGVLGRF